MAEDMSSPGWSAEMDPQEHLGTYQGFLNGTKWGIAFLIVLLSAMAFFLV